MNPSDADAILREWAATRDSTLAGLDPELQAVCTALFLEDTFGITLTDEQIEPGVLGTVAAMHAVLAPTLGEA